MALWSSKKKDLHSSQNKHSLGDSFTSLADTVIRVIKRNGADAVEIERDSPTQVRRTRPKTTRTRKTTAKRATASKRVVSAKTTRPKSEQPKSTPKKHRRKQSAPKHNAPKQNATASPRRTAVQRVSSSQRSSSTKPSTRQSVSTTTRRTTKTSNSATRILIEPHGQTGRRLHVSEWQERVGLSDRCLNPIERQDVATSLADASPVGIKEAQTLNRKFQALGIGVGDKHGYYAVCGRDGVSFRKTSFSCLPEKEAREYPNVRYISAKVMDKQLERLFGLSLSKVKSTPSADLVKQFGKLDEVLEQRSSKQSSKPKKSAKPRAQKPASPKSASQKSSSAKKSSPKAQPKRKPAQRLPEIDKIDVKFDKQPKASPKPQSSNRMNPVAPPQKPKVSVPPPPVKEPVAAAPKPSASAPAQGSSAASAMRARMASFMAKDM